MSTMLHCTQGHDWECPSGATAAACPECGEPGGLDWDASSPWPHTPDLESCPATVLRPALADAPPASPSRTILRPALASQPVVPSRRLDGGSATQHITGTGQAPARAGWPDLPGYEILGELGKGGMGVVYKARHLALGRVVALKMILGGSQADAGDKARFQREAQAVAKLQHPNIVQIFDVGEFTGNGYFSLEFVEGGSLADRLKAGALSVPESARLIEVLARAVHFAHDRGVVHRDLKPANILLGQRREEDTGASAQDGVAWAGVVPKIADFGLAKQLDDDTHNTRTGMVVGTPSYMAPEQAKGKEVVGPPADIWALGVLLYQLVTQKLPFVGDSPMEVLIKVSEAEPDAPSRHAPRLPRDLQTVILKCLEKDPRRRYASARELADDLARFLAHEPILARPVSGLERAARWVKRRPATSALLAVAALTLFSLLGTVAVYMQSERSRRAAALADVDLALRRAGEAKGRQAWGEVRTILEASRSRVIHEPALAPRRAAVEGLAKEADGQEAARAAFRSFVLARDDALFHATLAADAPAQREQTRQKLLNALALIGGSATREPKAPEYATPGEKKEIVESGYELLLALAEAASRPLPRQTKGEVREGARKALAVLDTAGRMGIKTRAYHLFRSRLMLTDARKPDADAEERKAWGAQPGGALDCYLTGIEQYRRGETEDAEECFADALRRQPGHFWARYFRALCLLRLDDLAAAEASLTGCLAQREVAWIYLVRGYVQGVRGKEEDSERDFGDAMRMLAEGGDSNARFVLFNNRAVARLSAGKAAEARADLEQAAALQPDQFQPFVTLAQVHLADHPAGQAPAAANCNRALSAMGKAVENAVAGFARKDIDAATLAGVYRQRFRVANKAGDVLRAQADIDAALALAGLEPDFAAALHRDRGHLLFRVGLVRSAEEAYGRALTLAPRDSETWRWHGEAMLRLREDRKAEASFTRGRELAPRPDAGIARGRAAARLRLGDLPGALEDFAVAVALLPKDGALRVQRGQAYLAARAWKQAEEDFDAAAGLKADPALTLHGAGMARLQQGKVAAALKDARAAAEVGRQQPRQLVALASLLAQISARPEAARDAGPCRDLGAALLARALNATPAGERRALWRSAVAGEPAFAPLAGHRTFAALARAHGGMDAR